MSVSGPVEILAIEVLVRREPDGTVTSVEVSQADGDDASAWAALEGAS
jgi:hypothetical protein